MKQELFAAVQRNDLVAVKTLLRDNSAFDINQTDDESWTVLHHACNLGFVDLTDVLLLWPRINVNAKSEDDWTPLMYACYKGRDAIVVSLLKHPSIDVNTKNYGRATAFLVACSWGTTKCALLLLDDYRTKVSEPDSRGKTPLRFAVVHEHIDIVKLYLAIALVPTSSPTLALTDTSHYGRDYNDQEHRRAHLGTEQTDNVNIAAAAVRTSNPPHPDDVDIIAVARTLHPPRPDIVELLKKYKVDPVTTRRQLRLELGLTDKLAADMFALIIFLCDGLLAIKSNSTVVSTSTNTSSSTTTTMTTVRFFNIAEQLPMELQMILCYRVAESVKVGITGANSEPAFRSLAQNL